MTALLLCDEIGITLQIVLQIKEEYSPQSCKVTSHNLSNYVSEYTQKEEKKQYLKESPSWVLRFKQKGNIFLLTTSFLFPFTVSILMGVLPYQEFYVVLCIVTLCFGKEL